MTDVSETQDTLMGINSDSAVISNKRKRCEDRQPGDSDEEIKTKRDKESPLKDSDDEISANQSTKQRNTRRFPGDEEDDDMTKTPRKIESDTISQDLDELQQYSARPATIQEKKEEVQDSRKERIQRKRSKWIGEMALKGKEIPSKIKIGTVEIGSRMGRPRKSLKTRTQKTGAEVVNQTVMSLIGRVDEEIDVKLLKTMTASDIGNQIIDYAQDFDVIRAKSKNIQGTLSGEMRKRINYVKEAVRTLQEKADEKGDPQILRQKIDDLKKEIKEGKREEERRDRELSEMKDIIKKLKDENRSMKEEVRKV